MIIRKIATIMTIFAGLFVVALAQPALAKPMDKIVLSSPFSPLVMPLAYIKENKLLDEFSDNVELKIWNNPSQLRAMVTEGNTHFISIPTNVASLFYNKGVPLKLVRVSIWGVFYIVSSDTQISALADLKGQKIFVPFPGDQPDLVFRTVAKARGLDPAADFQIQYVPSPLDVVMNLLAGKAKHAMMIEPAATVAIMKAKGKGITIKRVIDMQTEWGYATGGEARLPNAGVAALPAALKNPELTGAFAKAYDEAVLWTVNNPKEAALLAAKYVEGVKAPAFEAALEYTIFESLGSVGVRDKIELMFGKFIELNPKSIGGKLPDDGFYFGDAK